MKPRQWCVLDRIGKHIAGARGHLVEVVAGGVVVLLDHDGLALAPHVAVHLITNIHFQIIPEIRMHDGDS